MVYSIVPSMVTPTATIAIVSCFIRLPGEELTVRSSFRPDLRHNAIHSGFETAGL